jgi:alkanesulfonate monooxygenase SsuD/methylene tetrahydromethanopterin reductase-like flavin-dependent oxidoreductase (luciferase family)
MDLGFFNQPLHLPGRDAGEAIAEDVEQFVLLDELGFAEGWLGEHFCSSWESLAAPDIVLANVLGRTKNIKVGTGVNALPSHNPLTLAHRIAVLDQLAQGRFMWGIGSGGFGPDLELWEIDGANLEQRQLTRDVLDTVLDLWNDPAPGPRRHARWSFTVPERVPSMARGLHAQPFHRPHPPIAVAGIGPRSDMLTIGGARGWIPMSLSILVPETVRMHWLTYSESAQQAGLFPSREIWRVAREVYVGETSESARDEALNGTLGRDFEQFWFPELKHSNVMIAVKEDAQMPDEDVTLEYLAENVWIVGDVEEVTEKLYQLYTHVGGFGTLLVNGHEWRPREQWVASMTRLAKEVIPRLEERIGASPFDEEVVGSLS